MQIIIPMAGAGSRFSQAGYQLPKPLIDVAGEPMISRVMDNLGTNHQYWFIVQKAVWAEHSVQLTRAAQKCAMHTFLLTDGLTQGAAETCLLAERMWDPEEPLMIANCDQITYLHNDQDPLEVMQQRQLDGLILTFESQSNKNSYVEINDQGYVIRVAEKEVISSHATTGAYLWAKAKYFSNSARKMIVENVRVNNEFYVAPVYSWNIKKGLKIGTLPVLEHWPIGTPEDLNMYLQEKHVHHA
jgi:UDP-N-acetylglucosamine diphosphorylase / glucose-1-phosphate thymidylyltransferase / UDP-N-acetylgalactosamine diphosphorylase / glucosamine-1-phosphate N-acetyltransferase / galactosamine-1-phosphate N-acetyltransferase